MRLLLILFATAMAWAQEAPAEHKHAMPEPKNLQVLKVSGAELMPIMQAYSTGLGVKCDFCHVKGDFASDDKPHKNIARKMIAMANEINGQFPDGKTHVTCYTCHRGETEPAMKPGEAHAHEEHKH